jgi:stage IV sporulation protein FB
MLIVIALFIYLAATAEAQHVAFRDGAQGLPVREAMMRPIETLSPAATLDDAVDLLIRTAQKEFPVVDATGLPRGLLTKDLLIRALRQGGPGTPVIEAMARDIPSVGHWRPLETSLRTLMESKAPALMIVDDGGRLVGLLTPENVGEMMLVRSVRPDWRFRRTRAVA